MKRVRHQLMFIAAVLLLIPGDAHAQNCTFSIDSLNFGNIDVTANTTSTTSGTYSASCTLILLPALRTCPNVGAGTGGGNASGNPRYLTSGANQLAYNLYSDSSYTTVWGSRLWAGSAPPTDITTVTLTNGNTSRTMFARVPAGQQAVPPGTYTSSITGHTAITYQAYLPLTGPPDCATLASPSGTAPFTVTANVVASCSVSATTLDFGSAGVLQSYIDSTNTLSVTCSATVPYSVSLDGGLSGATDPTQRKMKKASEAVTYGLYLDAARSQPWGNSVGTNTASGTGSGFAQTYTVYGQVKPQATPSPGTYTDTIVVTVAY
jgi:spore coat protein U-like protein